MSKQRNPEDGGLAPSVSTRSVLRTPIAPMLKSERVQRTLSKISKASNWIGSISDDKKAEQLFIQLQNHVKGYPLASTRSPPDVKMNPLTRKMMGIDEVKIKGTVSVKKGREAPKIMSVRLLDGLISLKSAKKRSVALSRKNSKGKIGASGPVKLVSGRQGKSGRRNTGLVFDQASFSQFYDITYRAARPVQFKVRFYESTDSSSPKFVSYSIRLESAEECSDWIRTFIASIKQMHDFLKSLLESFISDGRKEMDYDNSMCDRYAKCLLDLTFWLYGLNSKETVANIELYEKFLVKTDFDKEALSKWQEKREDILKVIDQGESDDEGVELTIVEKLRNEVLSV